MTIAVSTQRSIKILHFVSYKHLPFILHSYCAIPLYKEFIQNGQVSFELVKPGTYFARIIIDEDWNGEWTTGKYDEQKQPEKVFYFEKPIMLRKNWDLEETWEYQKLNVLNQKPMEIKSPTSK